MVTKPLLRRISSFFFFSFFFFFFFSVPDFHSWLVRISIGLGPASGICKVVTLSCNPALTSGQCVSATCLDVAPLPCASIGIYILAAALPAAWWVMRSMLGSALVPSFLFSVVNSAPSVNNDPPLSPTLLFVPRHAPPAKIGNPPRYLSYDKHGRHP